MVCLENCDPIAQLVMLLSITLNGKAELVCESGVQMYLHCCTCPGRPQESQCSLSLDGNLHLCEEHPVFPRQFLFSSVQGSPELGGTVPDTIQGHQGEEQAQTTLTVKEWLSCFFQVLSFSRILSHYANSFSTHVLYMWLCATEVF